MAKRKENRSGRINQLLTILGSLTFTSYRKNPMYHRYLFEIHTWLPVTSQVLHTKIQIQPQ